MHCSIQLIYINPWVNNGWLHDRMHAVERSAPQHLVNQTISPRLPQKQKNQELDWKQHWFAKHEVETGKETWNGIKTWNWSRRERFKWTQVFFTYNSACVGDVLGIASTLRKRLPGRGGGLRQMGNWLNFGQLINGFVYWPPPPSAPLPPPAPFHFPPTPLSVRHVFNRYFSISPRPRRTLQKFSKPQCW